MIVNAIVISVSVLMAGFVLVRLVFPSTRAWFEAPKYRFLFDETRHAERHSPDGPRNGDEERGRESNT